MNNEYAVLFSYKDYKRLYDYNKRIIGNIIDNKWPDYSSDIKKILFGSVYKVFFDYTASVLEKNHGLDYKQLLDCLTVKHLNFVFERIIDVLENSNFVFERYSDINVFKEFSGYFASCGRKEFMNDSVNKKHITPYSYLKKINSCPNEKIDNLSFKLVDYENIKDNIEEDYDACINSDLDDEEKIAIRDDAKNTISWFIINKFGDTSFSGIAVSKFYRGFFGDKASEVVEELKKVNIKVPNNNLNSIMPAEMFDMFVVMHNVLKKQILSTDYVDNKYVNEVGLLMDAYLIGAIAKEIYISYYGLTPIDSLIFYNKSELKDVKNVRVGKKTKKEVKPIVFKNDEGVQLAIDNSFYQVEGKER